MLLRRPGLFALVTTTVALLAAACSASGPTPTPECFLAQAGQIVGANGTACAPPPGVTVQPTPTFTPAPTNGGATSGPALLIFHGCAVCHTLAPVPQMKGQDGPELTGVGSKGADYIRESILDPNATVVEGFEAGLMPEDFSTRISAEELDTIVSYLAGQ